MKQIDWTTFSQKIYINAPMHRVYDAWTTRASLEKWFLRKAEFTIHGGSGRPANEPVQEKDAYEWMWHGHPDTTVEHGLVMQANGRDKFQFAFGKAGVVTVDLKQEGGATELILTQHQIPTDEQSKHNYYVGCSTGWTFYLANLKSILEGGLDLRNRNPAYSNVINS
jgi:uncharacterized protein YndB with AHSA1/START domain